MQLDRSLDTPLYLQLATALKHRIASGKLRSGDELPSLRDGAAEWEVNLHTIRKAYDVLENAGFVTTKDRSGTTVADFSMSPIVSLNDEIRNFVDATIREARIRFGLSPEEFVRRMMNGFQGTESDGRFLVIECSATLRDQLAEQIEPVIGRSVETWPLNQIEDLPAGTVLATYFHFHEVRKSFQAVGRTAFFFSAHISEESIESILHWLDPISPRLCLCGTDCITARTLAMELEEALGSDIQMDIQVTSDPARLIEEFGDDRPIMVTPENWDRLDEHLRNHPAVEPLRFTIPEVDINRLRRTFALQ